MPTILITGANRGIGLDAPRAYAADGWRVIAAKTELLCCGGCCHAGQRSRGDPLRRAGRRRGDDLAERLRGRRPFDVLFAQRSSGAGSLKPELITRDVWRPIMLTNAYAPLRLASLLEPNLRAGSGKVLAAISRPASTLGTDGHASDFAYRASRAALNQLWRTLSVSAGLGLQGPAALPRQHAAAAGRDTGFPTRSDAVASLRTLIASVSLEQSGQHWSADGHVLPW